MYYTCTAYAGDLIQPWKGANKEAENGGTLTNVLNNNTAEKVNKAGYAFYMYFTNTLSIRVEGVGHGLHLISEVLDLKLGVITS